MIESDKYIANSGHVQGYLHLMCDQYDRNRALYIVFNII